MNDSELENFRDDVKEWFDETLVKLGIENVDQISPAKCMKLNKDIIAGILCSAIQTIKEQCDIIPELRTAASAASDLKTQLIKSQLSVIKLQSELLSSKDDQLISLQKTVEVSVQDSVKAEFHSYSSVVQKNLPTVEAFNSETVKKAVKEVVEEGDRNRNEMLFGLPEEDEEKLVTRVSDIFEMLGEKPRIEASRIGASACKVRPRLVKFTLANSTTIRQILSRAKELRQDTKYK